MSPLPPRPGPAPAPTRPVTAPCCACRRHHPGQHQHQHQRRADQSPLPAAHVAASSPEPANHGSLLRRSPPPSRPTPPPAATRPVTAPCCACRRHHPSQHHHQRRPGQSRLPAAHVAAITPANTTASADPASHGSLLRTSPAPGHPAPAPAASRRVTAPCCACRRHHPGQHRHRSMHPPDTLTRSQPEPHGKSSQLTDPPFRLAHHTHGRAANQLKIRAVTVR